jgi:3,4-dihydroxy 2-butanone 4-phosphate synthase/GTP cyclohydrolase II
MNDPIEATRAAHLQNKPPAGRPFVCLSYAQSLDGSIAAKPGTPTPISSSHSLRMTHQLRAVHDVLLIGVGTAIADDPRLTVRGVDGNDPAAVVLDSNLRLPTDSRLLAASRRSHVFCAQSARHQRSSQLISAGASIHAVARDDTGLLDLHAVLSELRSAGYRTVMVEGGALVIGHFLRKRFVDWIVLTIAPLLLGGLRIPFSDPPIVDWKPVRVAVKGTRLYGDDTVLWGPPEWEPR